MGGSTVQPTVQWSTHWYVREISITRSESGFAQSRFTLQIALGRYLAGQTDPVTGNTLFEVWATRQIDFTGQQLLEWVAALPEAERQGLLSGLLSAESTIAATADQIITALAGLGRLSLAAASRIS